jgi:hypothetical protein
MKDYLLPLFIVTPLLVLSVIAFCIWHAYRLHRRIRGTAPWVPSPRFSNFMCTLLLPDTFHPKAALLDGQSAQVRAEIAGRVPKMRIGILVAAGLVVLLAASMIIAAKPA